MRSASHNTKTKDITRKENDRPISHENAKILNKILTN
jgi:hypothetical protein